MSNNKAFFLQLFTSVQAVQHVYEVAIYGKKHREVILLNLIGKVTSKSPASLNRKDLKRAIEEIEAIKATDNTKLAPVSFTTKEINIIRKALNSQLKIVRTIPLLARFQAVIALSAAFEGFISDAIKYIYDEQPDVLKSGKSTLKDDELIDSLQSGKTLSLLKDNKLRNVMFGSVKDWYNYLRKTFGLPITDCETLIEMFLIRNAIAHNNGLITQELISFQNSRYKRLGAKINVTEKDLQRYLKYTTNNGDIIWKEIIGKFL